jgi:hypothetical protein
MSEKKQLISIKAIWLSVEDVMIFADKVKVFLPSDIYFVDFINMETLTLSDKINISIDNYYTSYRVL